MGKTKGRSLRLRSSKKRSKKNYKKNYRKNYKKHSMKKSKKNSKKYRKRSRKTKRSLRGVKRSMRMKGGARRLEEQGIFPKDTSMAGNLAELRKKWIKEGLTPKIPPPDSYIFLKQKYDKQMEEKHEKMEAAEDKEEQKIVDHDKNLEDVLRECNIPEIYWAKIKGVFKRIGGDRSAWPIVLKKMDGENGGEIWKSVELLVDQEVKVWSETAGGWGQGRVKEVLDDGTKVKVKYEITIMGDDNKQENKQRITTKSIDDPKLDWKFRGELATLQ
jgi:hypothetical protein